MKVKEPKFCIKDYIWYIFEIHTRQNQVNIRIAYDMFILNLELDSERYKGAKGLKYRKVRNLWKNLKDKDKEKQRRIFLDIMNKNIITLFRLYGEDNKELFDAVCHGNYIRKSEEDY